MTSTFKAKAHRRVGAVAIAAFVALLLIGAARGQGQVETGAPAVATPSPDSTLPAPEGSDPGASGVPSDPGEGRGEFGGRRAPG